MKILLDANISWKLVTILSPVFGECVHIDLLGLTVPIEDKDIWKYALTNGYTIITKDNDFLDLLISAKSEIEDMENNNYGLLEIYGPLELIK
jgi:predicted nuclease of predicted toxin-antitoxin system